MTPPYELSRGTRAAAGLIERATDLEHLLRLRDGLMDNRGGREEIYFVTDADDAERGNAEWCEECGEEGIFGSECEGCA